MKKISACLLASVLMCSGSAFAETIANNPNVNSIHMNMMDQLTAQPITVEYEVCDPQAGSSGGGEPSTITTCVRKSVAFSSTDKVKTIPAAAPYQEIYITQLKTADNTVIWGPYHAYSNEACVLQGKLNNNSVTFMPNQDRSITCSSGQG
jgi:hypothetical protein